jgi:hypothetical protein
LDSTHKKLVYLVPQSEKHKIGGLLRKLEQTFQDVYFDIEMNSLEDAYL